MSGLEVVGLVLGIVPLVISTVKHFNTAASYWKLLANTNHANSEYRKIWNEIENERLLYHQQLRKLLMPLIHTGIFSKDELEEFVLDPRNDFKQSLFVDLALKQRLGATHERYLDITTEIQILSARLLQWLPPEIAVAPQAGQVDVGHQNLIRLYPKLTTSGHYEAPSDEQCIPVGGWKATSPARKSQVRLLERPADGGSA